MRRVLTLASFTLLISAVHGCGSFTIGNIDFYGLRTISETEVRGLLPFSEDDVRVRGSVTESLKSEIAEALNVARVEIINVCCREDGLTIVYIGIEETPTFNLDYHAQPTGDAMLPREILKTADELDAALNTIFRSVQSGNAVGPRGDASAGHALFIDPELRALQERYLIYADQFRERLIEVLHNSADDEQRAIAATVIAYASDKVAVVPHLEDAVLDSSDGVRNDATRALAIIAMYANEHPELGIEISPDVYVDMLNSIEWSDRNKASALLMSLTSSRDPELLAQLEERSLLSLIEMCRWKSDGHAFMSCRILERVVGRCPWGPGRGAARR